MPAPWGNASSTPAPSNRRWAVLAAVSAAQAVLACLFVALPVLVPMLRTRFGLGIHSVGLLLASVNLGMTLTLVPWGHLADRVGERVVLATGLAATAAGLVGGAVAPSFPLLLVALLVVGLFGGSVNSATTRAVLAWFGAEERGLALAIRQTAIPLGGAGFAILVPHLAHGSDTQRPFLFLAAFAFVSAAAVAVVVRKTPSAVLDSGHVEAVLLRNRRIWKVCGSAAATLFGQSTIVGFSVLFLRDERGFSTAFAAAMLAACQVLGALVLLAAGRFSDRTGRRIAPLRVLTAAGSLLLFGVGGAVGGPTAILLTLLIVAGGVSFGWVALSSAAAGESVHPRQIGAASGLQQAAMATSATLAPLLVAAVIGAAGWRSAFLLAAAGPALGFGLLSGLADRGVLRQSEADTPTPQLEASGP